MSDAATIRELSRLEAGALLELYVLDATELGGDILFFYGGTNILNAPITWQGIPYQPMPVQARGWAFTGQGSPPRPSIVFGNVGGTFSALVQAFEDLVGARLYRKRVFAQFLDGMPAADPSKHLPDEIFIVERKVAENRFSVEFELGTNLDIEDAQIPNRLIYANLCGWRYRGEGCGFAGNTCRGDVSDNVAPNYAGQVYPPPAPGGPAQNYRGVWSSAATYHTNDVVYRLDGRGLRHYYWCRDDNAGAGISGTANSPTNTARWTADECSRRVAGCMLRFKLDPTGLPFGGFPATARLTG